MSEAPPLIATGRGMRDVLEAIAKIAPTDTHILLRGESGTGRAHVARTIHAQSTRRQGPFVALRVQGLAAVAIERELSRATADNPPPDGEPSARGGTLFVDELAGVPAPAQLRLLRALAAPPRDGGVRLIAGSKRAPEDLLRAQAIREDLLRQVAGAEILLPPLRERPEDIVPLARHFLRELGATYGRGDLELTPVLEKQLLASAWPGNVRELRSVLDRAVALTPPGAPLELQPKRRLNRRRFALIVDDYLENGRGLDDALGDLERALLEETLRRFGGNQSRVARYLKIPRQTLQARLRKYRLGDD